jgi:hypothetical protein
VAGITSPRQWRGESFRYPVHELVAAETGNPGHTSATVVLLHREDSKAQRACVPPDLSLHYSRYRSRCRYNHPMEGSVFSTLFEVGVDLRCPRV